MKRADPQDQDEAARTAPAPGDLGIVQAFVNTADPRAGREELGTPRALERWLSRHGLLPAGARLTEEDRRRAVEVREGLRALMLANNGVAVDAGAVDRLDRAISEARFQLRLELDGSARFEPASEGVDGALGALLAIMVRARVAGSWRRAKACGDPTCRRAFYDASRNAKGKWCSERCGARMRAQAYRRTDKYKTSVKPKVRIYRRKRG